MNPSIQDEDARVSFNREVGEDIFLMGMQAPTIAASACPGQFVMLRVRDAPFPLLRRPFSICRVEDDSLQILYAVVGEGTRILSATSAGDAISVLGPLGRGFDAPSQSQAVFFVGGGMGIAPLLFLAGRHTGMNRYFLAGFKSSKKMIDFVRLGFVLPNPTIVTEDGSFGRRGLLTDLLSEMLEKEGKRGIKIYACGPVPMLKAVVALTRRFNISSEVSLESKMACGLGACQGCAIPKAGGGYLHACKDGPVFDSQVIRWEAL